MWDALLRREEDAEMKLTKRGEAIVGALSILSLWYFSVWSNPASFMAETRVCPLDICTGLRGLVCRAAIREEIATTSDWGSGRCPNLAKQAEVAGNKQKPAFAEAPAGSKAFADWGIPPLIAPKCGYGACNLPSLRLLRTEKKSFQTFQTFQSAL